LRPAEPNEFELSMILNDTKRFEEIRTRLSDLSSMRLGRKLTFDTKTEQYIDDAQVNGFIEREQRSRYEIKI